jgi:hypothetical protein
MPPCGERKLFCEETRFFRPPMRDGAQRDTRPLDHPQERRSGCRWARRRLLANSITAPGRIATAFRPRVIAQIMRHTKVDPTMNVYTQVLDGAARAAADRVGSELFRIVQNPEGSTAPTD